MDDQLTIIGAGIGGLSTALALKHSGKAVTIYESASEIKPVGAGIAIANNAMQVFDRLGVRPSIEEAGIKITDIQITDAQLKVLSSTNLDKFERQYGVYNIAIHRADLQRILAEKIGYEHIHLSKRLKNIEQDGGLSLSFEDGTQAKTAWLIGADGIKSQVRNQLFHAGTIRDTGQRCWRGVTSASWATKYNHLAIEAWDKGRRFGFVNLKDDKIYWYAVVNDSMLSDHNDILSIFQSFHPEIKQMIADTPTDQIHYSDLLDLKPMTHWSQKNVCLIGDAAHATTPNMGQGACQAVEDAYVLGMLLRQGRSITETFAQYERLRLKKAHYIVNNSWTLGKMAHMENPLVCWVRDWIIKAMPSSIQERQFNRIFNIDYPI